MGRTPDTQRQLHGCVSTMPSLKASQTRMPGKVDDILTCNATLERQPEHCFPFRVRLSASNAAFESHTRCICVEALNACLAASAGETCLALPKLNLQFLTIHDYLLRNFNLFRLEATYEIREDIADVLGRVGGVADSDEVCSTFAWLLSGCDMGQPKSRSVCSELHVAAYISYSDARFGCIA